MYTERLENQQLLSNNFPAVTIPVLGKAAQSPISTGLSVPYCRTARGKQRTANIAAQERKKSFPLNLLGFDHISYFVEHAFRDSHKIVFDIMARYTQPNGYCDVSYKTLADMTGYCIRTIASVVKDFREWGIIKCIERRYSQTSAYILNKIFTYPYIRAALAFHFASFAKYRPLDVEHLRLREKTRSKILRRFERANAHSDEICMLNRANHSRDLFIEAKQAANNNLDIKHCAYAQEESMEDYSSLFTLEQLKQLSKFSSEALAHGQLRLKAALAAGTLVRDKFAYFKKAAEGYVPHSAQHSAASASADASPQGRQTKQEASNREYEQVLNSRESRVYEAADLPELKQHLEDATKQVKEANKTLLKDPSPANSAYLDAFKKDLSYWTKKFYETCVRCAIKPEDVKTPKEAMIPPAPLPPAEQAKSDGFAAALKGAMPDTVKAELSQMRKDDPNHPKIKNNHVLHAILNEWESTQMTQKSFISEDKPPSKATILTQ